MTVDISSIKNEAIRKAAQQADLSGANAYNGFLDKNEVSVFVEIAKNNGCNMEEVMDLAQKSGMDANTEKNVNKTMKITQLEKNIATKKKVLNEKYKQYEKMEVPPTTGQYVGRIVGSLTTAGIGVAAILTTLSGPIGWTVAGIAAATCWLPGYVYGDAIASPDTESYEYKVKQHDVYKQSNAYKQKEIAPLEAEIKQLEVQLAHLKNN